MEKLNKMDHLINTVNNSINSEVDAEEAAEVFLWCAAIAAFAADWSEAKIVGRMAHCMCRCKEAIKEPIH